MRPGQLSDKKVQRQLSRQEKQAQDDAIEDLRAVIATAAGRRFFYRLVYNTCGLKESLFDGNIKDGGSSGQHMAWKDGARYVGKALEAAAERHCPEEYLLCHQERIADRLHELDDRKQITGDK